MLLILSFITCDMYKINRVDHMWYVIYHMLYVTSHMIQTVDPKNCEKNQRKNGEKNNGLIVNITCEF